MKVIRSYYLLDPETPTTTRVIYVEVALITDSCKQVICRFIATQAALQEIYSDRSTDFQGIRSELDKEIRSVNESLASTVTNQRIPWKFNPPYAP